MDNRLLFLYRCYGDKGGTRQGKPGIPIGHGVSFTLGDARAGKSTLDTIAEKWEEAAGRPKAIRP